MSTKSIAKQTGGAGAPIFCTPGILPAGVGALAGLLVAVQVRRKTTSLLADTGGETRALKSIMKPLFRWATRRALVGRARSTSSPEQGRFTRAEVDRILKQLWRNYDELVPGIPREPTIGARMNVRLACATIAAYQALLAAGIEKDEAVMLIADVAWEVCGKGAMLPGLVSRAFARDPVRRLRIATNLVRRFPFNPPGYVMEDVPADDMVAFDVRRCPVGEYFRSYDLGQLCMGTWCSQDYAFAEIWGGKLERSGTLAAGDDRCDFRWKVVRAGQGKGHAQLRSVRDGD